MEEAAGGRLPVDLVAAERLGVGLLARFGVAEGNANLGVGAVNVVRVTAAQVVPFLVVLPHPVGELLATGGVVDHVCATEEIMKLLCCMATLAIELLHWFADPCRSS